MMTEETKALCNRLYLAEREAVKLKQHIEDLRLELTAALCQAGTDVAYGTEGIGYKLSRKAPQYRYKPEAVNYVIERGLGHAFVKLTQKGLEDLRKQGALSHGDLAVIERYTEKVGGDEFSLRQVVDKAYQAEILAMPVVERSA